MLPSVPNTAMTLGRLCGQLRAQTMKEKNVRALIFLIKKNCIIYIIWKPKNRPPKARGKSV